MRRVPRIACLVAAIASISARVYGLGYTYEALIDVDNNPSTGGDVTIVQGAEAPHAEHGIDYRVQIFGNPCLNFNDTQVLHWDGANFTQTATTPDTYPSGTAVGQGLFGSKLVEWQVPSSSIPEGLSHAKIIFHASISEKQVNDYTSPVFLGGSIVSVPTLAPGGLVALVVLLGALALVVLRRRAGRGLIALVFLGLLGAATAAWAAGFTIDGLNTDWAGISPNVTDPAGDSSVGDANEDILYAFVQPAGANIAFRMDVGNDSSGCM